MGNPNGPVMRPLCRVPVRPLLLLFVALTARVAQAQDPLPPAVPQARPTIVVAEPGKTQRITLRDGSEILGRILSVGETSVEFASALGVTTIAKESILSVKDERGGTMREGRYYFENPNATRLIFAPTGRMLEQGEGYFSDYWIFFPGFSVGLSNQFSIGGGMSIIPGLGFDEQIFYFTPKLGVVQGENFNAAVGALVVSVPGFDSDNASAGILYGIGTWGSPDQSFTTGLGYGYADGTLADRPMLMFGGEARIAPRAALVTENYVLPGGHAILSGGVRFLGRGLSVDFALANIMGNGQDEGFCCLPFLGFVWKW